MRPRRSLAVIAILATPLALAACKHVSLEPAAEQVAVATPAEVAACKKVGRTSTQVLSKIMGFGRSEEKMGRELDTLARNAAGDLGGDTVVRDGAIESGKAKYNVYTCAGG